MTVEELIKTLQKFDGKTTVVRPKLDFQGYFGKPSPRLMSLKQYVQGHYGLVRENELKNGDTGELVLIL